MLRITDLKFILLISTFVSILQLRAQGVDSVVLQLDTVTITSARIDIPFKDNSRTISIIDAQHIENSPASNMADLLQGVAGIDIRRRGVDGMQSDIYIRGGHFNQTLILVDGIKTADPQTGHHTMNMILPLETIERIEIVKGPAARIFGQNAFLGAINIVTKKQLVNQVTIDLSGGSFDRRKAGLTAAIATGNSSHLLHADYSLSNGYRTNTDFHNQNYFLKSSFKTKAYPIDILMSFADRKFGAQYFYTFTPIFNEYEETQTSLVGVSTKFVVNHFVIKPKIYWKRNQDMFLLRRDDPSFSRNFNISNKNGAEVNTSFSSKIGVTGFGVDMSIVSLESNNLGNQYRSILNTFVEHRFSLLNNKLDITPGVSFNYFSDFGFHSFPGMDVGYKVSEKWKVFGNVGYSYRLPTYTELYINIPNFLSGNADLKPEKALAEELGMQFRTTNFRMNVAWFRRDAKDLIDYVKMNDSALFEAQNLREITTMGFEVNTHYMVTIKEQAQGIKLGYTFLEDDYHDTDVFASRYLLNTSIKHHFTAEMNFQLLKLLRPSITYRYVERPTNAYGVTDVKLSVKLKSLDIYGIANNIFNTEYFEKENVLMPEGNFMLGLKYRVAY